MSPLADFSNERDKSFYLLSFSPETGIGFYEVENSLFVLDLLASQDLKIEPDVAGYILSLTGNQLEAGVNFESKDAMCLFMQREYLTDKKNRYYAEILAFRIKPERREQLLRFLDDDKLVAIKMSDDFVKVTSKLYDQSAVEAAIVAVKKLELTNVQNCLLNEFTQISTIVDGLQLVATRSTRRAERKENEF